MRTTIPKQRARPALRSRTAHAPSIPTAKPEAASCACGGGCPRCAAPLQDAAALERDADGFAELALQQRTTVLRPRAPAAAAALPPPVREGFARTGRPLAASDRAFFEPRLGADLHAVRLHDDATAFAAATALGASAYTVGPHIVLGPRAPDPASSAGRRLLAHELAHVAQQAAGGTRLQRQPAPEIEMPAELAIEPRRRGDRAYAAQLGRTDAARLLRAGTLSAEERQAANGKLAFFEGAAKEAYAAAIRPALLAVTRPEIQMPAMDMSGDLAPPRPSSLSLLEPEQRCGGRPCLSDDEIYADLRRSEAEDAVAEARATMARAETATTRKALREDVARAQRGTRAHRHARERLETFEETGTLTTPYRNIEGAPAPETWVLGAAGGLLLGLALGEALIAAFSASEIVATATYTAGQLTTTAMSNPYIYLGAAVAYGAAAPPGSPDLPGPWDEVGKSLRALGVAAEDLEQFAKGSKVWGFFTRGAAKVTGYFQRAGDKLVSGVLSANWGGDRAGMIRAFLNWRQQSTLMARLLGAKVLRLEADVVVNAELLGRLEQLGFKPVEGSPGSFFLEIVLN
jgi:hypothetical protein